MFRTFLLLTSVIILCFNTILSGQPKGINREKYRINIAKTRDNIIIDGILDEDAWLFSDKTCQFQRVLPTDTGYAAAQTEVKLTYTESTLFIGIICFDPSPGKRPVESLRRDFNFGKNDNFIAFIDTYNDQTNGFAFGISPAGAQWDGVQANGGFVNLDWGL